MAANESVNQQRKQMVVSSLCRHFALDPEIFLVDSAGNGIKELYSNILKSVGNGAPFKNNDERVKWIEFAEKFPVDSGSFLGVLNKLNEELATKSVLLGDGLKPSEVDVVVFSAIHSSVIGLSNSDRKKLPHVMRWIDYIQNKESFGDIFEKILLEKPGFEPWGSKSVAKAEVESNSKKTAPRTKSAEKLEAEQTLKKKDAVEKATTDKEATQKKKKLPEKAESVEKDKEVSVSLLNIQVGLIRKAWKHPSADSLLVEEIDVGEAKLRQVVSGLAKYCSPDELTNRRIVLITNVKPGKLRDVMSEGLVLCASNEDHTIVQPLIPPEGAKIGERVSFSGIDGKPEDVLNPKKKQLEKITPHLFTDDKGTATFKGIPFMTTGGPCTSSIPKASIK